MDGDTDLAFSRGKRAKKELTYFDTSIKKGRGGEEKGVLLTLQRTLISISRGGENETFAFNRGTSKAIVQYQVRHSPEKKMGWRKNLEIPKRACPLAFFLE